jgi:predicted ATPase/DNA-binding SARP family transcriptional activator/DNA-binding CsgD family transcriptional regulator
MVLKQVAEKARMHYRSRVQFKSEAQEATGGVPETIRVHLFGGFRVSVGSREIDQSRWRHSKATALVKLLALAPGHRRHQEEVMNLLWPELDARAASNNLRQALHWARHALEPAQGASSSFLARRGDLLVMCPGRSLWVDIEAFEDAASAARRSREPGVYRTALDLYAGELLPEDRYEEWAEERREALRGTYLGLLLELAELYEKRGEMAKAVEALKRVVAEESTHEEAHVGLMRLYALTGRRVEALRQYERLQESLSRRAAAEPDPASRRLYEEIAAERFPPVHSPPAGYPSEESSAARRHNVPVARSSFVGRERELVEVKRELSMTRLLTLTGAGGSGKTRLALEVIRDLVGAYLDGVWVVELAPLSEPELVPQAVASALGVREKPSRPLIDDLADHISKKDLLLVLDNCEHVIDAAARITDTLLSACLRLKVLATSREALRVGGEVVWQVPPLSMPHPEESTSTDELQRSEAVRLFAQRARSRRPGFGLTERNGRAVAEICRRLDGIPLALELAAARVGMLSVEQISERLVDSLVLLRGGSRTTERRHQTLQGTLEWSYGLLTEAEQRLFERLSVFAGGWALEAAETVGAGGGISKEDVLDLLECLTDKSLVVVIEADEKGSSRYRLLEPVRQYARAKLEESGEAEATRRRHALWYLALAEEAEKELTGPHDLAWLRQLETEHDNLRAALRWFLRRGETELGLRLAASLGKDFWRTRERLREGLGWLEAALASGGNPSPTRAKALAHAGWIAWERLDFERSTVLSEEALTLSRELGYKEGTAAALYSLGMVAIHDQMRAEEAWELLENCLALRRELEDEVGAARTLQKLGLISVVRRDFERAQALYEEAIELVQKTGDKVGRAVTLWLGGLASLGLGNHERVKSLCREGLGVARQIEHMHAVALILHVLGASAAEVGSPIRSARLWGAAESMLDALGLGLGPAERYFYEPYFTVARTRLGEEAFEMAWAEGQSMTLEGAIEHALSSEEESTLPTVFAPEEQPLAAEPSDKLTRREREIATLVARGLTNRQIASKLSISEHTASTHVAKILKKLGLQSRAQMGSWLAEQGSPTSE